MILAAASTIAVPLCISDFEPPLPPPMTSTIAVALHERDLLERNAELLAQHLRERRGVAHAEIERAGRQRHRAVGVESDLGQLLRRAAP